MEAHAISLAYERAPGERYLVNLIDSPGHVDFSADVSSAVRLCDGALLVVDVVEGVCVQTHAVMRVAWEERVKMCLVVNKIDRLITELQLTPEEGQMHIQRVVEQVNAVLSGFIRGDDELTESSEAIEEAEARFLFSAARGDTVFASGTDSWAFSLPDFGALVGKLVGVPPAQVVPGLWGEKWWDGKTKSVADKQASASADAPMFTQFVLRNLWELYDVARSDPPKPKRLEKMMAAVGVAVDAEKLPLRDAKALTRTVMSAWLPASKALMETIVRNVPNPVEAQGNRVAALMPLSKSGGADAMAPAATACRDAVAKCDASGPVVVFISKMVPVPKSVLLASHAVPASALEDDAGDAAAAGGDSAETFVGIGRVYAGTVRPGMALQVIAPAAATTAEAAAAASATVYPLLTMGGDFLAMGDVPAGNVVGIAGLGSKLLKTGTLSTEAACPTLAKMPSQSAPILRVSVEPVDARDWEKLTRGLRLLNRADPALEVRVQTSGEHVVAAIGELHLERCMKDLRERFAKVEFRVSEPLASFRETLVVRGGGVPAPKDPVLSVSRAAVSAAAAAALALGEATDAAAAATARDAWVGPHGQVVLSKHLWERGVHWFVRAAPVPESEVEMVMRGGSQHHDKSESAWLKASNAPGNEWRLAACVNGCALVLPAVCDTDVRLREALVSGFTFALRAGPMCEEPMSNVVFVVEAATQPSGENGAHDALGGGGGGDSSLDEGSLVPTFADACKRAFRVQMEGPSTPYASRLMEGFYKCSLHCISDLAGDHLGKLYQVVSKRRGRVVAESTVDGTPLFLVEAVIPVVEAYGLADELRKRTSGAASSPQLVFSHWEVLDVDPFRQATTEEELEMDGATVDAERANNLAWRHVVAVRKRKGLPTGEKKVAAPDKQRTMSRKR